VSATIANPAQALIEEARRWVGTVESPRGSNRGLAVDFFNYQTALGVLTDGWKPYPSGIQGAPWCAAFVSTIGRLALGRAWPVDQTLSVARMVRWAEAKRVFDRYPDRSPEVGDLFVLYYEQYRRWAHVGIVAATDGGTIRTIEGNTGDDGTREGYGVLARTRTLTAAFGRIHWTGAL
jgi:hypothetical protein